MTVNIRQVDSVIRNVHSPLLQVTSDLWKEGSCRSEFRFWMQA